MQAVENNLLGDRVGLRFNGRRGLHRAGQWLVSRMMTCRNGTTALQGIVMSVLTTGPCSKTICSVCILVALTAILYGCGKFDSDRKNGAEARINSVASLRKYSVGKWCFFNQEDDRLIEVIIENSGQYVLYQSLTGHRNWARIHQGAILFGQGRYTSNRAKYYYIHLNGTAINFAINAGTPIERIVRQGMPVWLYYEPRSGPEIKLQWAKHNCKVGKQ